MIMVRGSLGTFSDFPVLQSMERDEISNSSSLYSKIGMDGYVA